jgi:nitronate monooxygenase
MYAITGAMLAGVDAITVGAGIPLQITGIINALLEGKVLKYLVPVVGEKESYEMSFDPEKFFGAKLLNLKKPKFLPIISSNVLAEVLLKKLPAGSIFGFIVETSTAGGHNAPPRIKGVFNEHGDPVYSEKDKVNYINLAKLGLPFWIGGSYASPEMLAWALQQGAAGIQVGSAFALCEESGLRHDLKVEARRLAFLGQSTIRTSPCISPSGFPFKVAMINGTLSEENVYKSRVRVCDKGVLVVLYKKADGSIGYRCSAEPVEDFVRKGGKIEDTIGAGCICNGLITTAGLKNGDEPPIVTLGDDLRFARILMTNENSSYTAEDVYKYLLS